MKFIFASERARLVRERNKYLADYDAKKKVYDEQENTFRTAYSGYADNMKKFISSFLAAEIEKLPGIKIEVKDRYESRRDTVDYYITFKYADKSHTNENGNNPYRHSNYEYGIDSGYYKGLNWSLTIFLKKVTKTDENGEKHEEIIVDKDPSIRADFLNADDYERLLASYTLFKKIDTIDWQSIINQINEGVPKRSQYVTAPDPGYKDTSKWDESITNYNISRIIGKDIWIKVNISREESYDRYNSNNAGVDGNGWIRVKSATDKFYIFNWIEARYRGNDDLFNESTVTSAARHTYKLKKIYISPVEPIEYVTTKELIEKPKPEFNLDGDDDE